MEAWDRAMENVRSGLDIVPAIILAVFETWPADIPGQNVHAREYNDTGPELKALERFRAAAGTRFLGKWSEPELQEWDGTYGWCQGHTRDEAIAMMEAFRDG